LTSLLIEQAIALTTRLVSELAMVGQLTVKTRAKSPALSREMVQAVKAARRDESA